MSATTAGFAVLAPMPHFYFHFRQGEKIIDDEGLDLPDLAAAQAEALKSIREIVAERVLAGDDFPDSITDADGKEITSVTVASVLPPRLKGC